MEDLNASTYDAHCGSIRNEDQDRFFLENKNARVDMMREFVGLGSFQECSVQKLPGGLLHKFYSESRRLIIENKNVLP